MLPAQLRWSAAVSARRLCQHVVAETVKVTMELQDSLFVVHVKALLLTRSARCSAPLGDGKNAAWLPVTARQKLPPALAASNTPQVGGVQLHMLLLEEKASELGRLQGLIGMLLAAWSAGRALKGLPALLLLPTCRGGEGWGRRGQQDGRKRRSSAKPMAERLCRPNL